jgi:hypothetical protein
MLKKSVMCLAMMGGILFAEAVAQANPASETTITGSVCQVQSGPETSAMGIYRGPSGFSYNPVGGPAYVQVTCPLPRINSGNTAGAYIYPFMSTGPSGHYYVFVYSLDVYGNVLQSQPYTSTYGAYQQFAAPFHLTTSQAMGTYNVTALLFAGATMNSITLNE